MMRLGFVIVFFILNFNGVIGQNLVNNPSFEEHGQLEPISANGLYSLTMANNWKSVGLFYSKYAHTDCDTSYRWNYNPSCTYNGLVNPKTGKACASITLMDNNIIGGSPNERQYIQTELSSPLLPGKYYKVGFHVILAKNCTFSGNGMGILFSDHEIQQNSAEGIFNILPQFYYPEFFSNTNGWEKKEKYFKSDFFATHLIIGFFAPIGQQLFQTNCTNPPINPSNNFPYSWLLSVLNYIDDVYVIPIAPVLEADSAICKGASATLTVRGEVEWKWAEASNPFQIIGTDSILTVTPTETTTYIYYGFSDTLQHTVYVRNPPLFKMGADTFLCKGNTLVLTPELEGQRYWWNTGDTTQSISVTESGAYKVTIQHGPCFVSDDVFVGFPQIPDFVKYRDTTVCLGEAVQYFVNEPFSVVTWNQSLYYNEYLIDTAGVQTIEVQNVCGHFQHDFTIHHKECPCLIWVPNAFSPNGDGVNDEFEIIAECRLEDFWYEIYDRWGTKVFSADNLYTKWIPDNTITTNLFVVKYYFKGKENADIVEKLKFKEIIIIK